MVKIIEKIRISLLTHFMGYYHKQQEIKIKTYIYKNQSNLSLTGAENTLF